LTVGPGCESGTYVDRAKDWGLAIGKWNAERGTPGGIEKRETSSTTIGQ